VLTSPCILNDYDEVLNCVKRVVLDAFPGNHEAIVALGFAQLASPLATCTLILDCHSGF
jgi:hypothetical protein